jgi:hypothetical protein
MLPEFRIAIAALFESSFAGVQHSLASWPRYSTDKKKTSNSTNGKFV